MKSIETDGVLVCYPTGRIDSTNAAAFEQKLTQALAEHPGATLVLDAERLEYISSAGLRVLLRQRQAAGELTVRNVSPEVYEIFDVTGFTAMLKVEKAMRFVSVKGLEQIGAGKHSAVYRLDGETILKAYLAHPGIYNCFYPQFLLVLIHPFAYTGLTFSISTKKALPAND